MMSCNFPKGWDLFSGWKRCEISLYGAGIKKTIDPDFLDEFSLMIRPRSSVQKVVVLSIISLMPKPGRVVLEDRRGVTYVLIM